MAKNALKAGRGYEFVKRGKGVLLRRKGAGAGGAGVNFQCACDLSGGCRVEIDGSEASCLENGCSGKCGWSVVIPGLSGVKLIARAVKPTRGPA